LPDFLKENEQFVGGFLLVRDVCVYGEVRAVHAHGAVGLGQLDLIEEVKAVGGGKEYSHSNNRDKRFHWVE
jgi:hypothetical protein